MCCARTPACIDACMTSKFQPDEGDQKEAWEEVIIGIGAGGLARIHTKTTLSLSGKQERYVTETAREWRPSLQRPSSASRL